MEKYLDVEDYINNQDWDSLLKWAYKHANSNESEETLGMVARSYHILMDNGIYLAANNLGSMYYSGLYFDENYLEAAKYYKIAAENGVEVAYGNLGCCFYYGKNIDYKKAYEAFVEGAILFDNVECLFRLGDMYRYGYHVEANEYKAYHLYERAIDIANKTNDLEREYAEALYRSAECTLNGIGTNIDPYASLFKLNVSLSILYKYINSVGFVKLEIKKVKALIKQAEKMIEVNDKIELNNKEID